MKTRRVIACADDFGLSEGVNDAVEQACRTGWLTTASLMVAGPAAADAVRRAQRLPGLRVGLHLVVIEGPAVGPAPGLVDDRGWFPSDQLRLGVDYFFRPGVRTRLRAEIAAQYAAFAATGLRLDHANAHKHMHMHPTVGRMLIEEGARYALPAIRIPAEPPRLMEAAGTAPSWSDRALFQATRLLRAQARRARVRTNDHVIGLAWSGHMTADRIAGLIPHLPPGLTELYFHPATGRDLLLAGLMPGYDHLGEFAALTDPALQAALDRAGVVRTTYDGV
ncbi:MAG: hopanoid biosynthesis-associated protein HpnK [Gemmatimonadaceae bacterium]|nr:hopanoid biosynthesis-associated protein HpnK [Acetobacteraceae bacterium]